MHGEINNLETINDYIIIYDVGIQLGVSVFAVTRRVSKLGI